MKPPSHVRPNINHGGHIRLRLAGLRRDREGPEENRDRDLDLDRDRDRKKMERRASRKERKER